MQSQLKHLDVKSIQNRPGTGETRDRTCLEIMLADVNHFSGELVVLNQNRTGEGQVTLLFRRVKLNSIYHHIP